MDSGYYVYIHSSVDDDDASPKRVLLTLGPTLEEGIAQISDAIRAWVLEDKPEGSCCFSVSIVGPIENPTPFPHLTAEQRLDDSASDDERFQALGDAAKSRFDAGDYDMAKAYASELEKILPGHRNTYGYNDAASSVKIVFGRLALLGGNVEEAERLLIEAGTTTDSPEMNSFGPNMSLAHDLLLAGRSDAVIGYFRLCEKTWLKPFSKLDEWTEDIAVGRIPDFGANLKY